MQLNELKPGRGAKQAPKRLGRGIGSGLGKTCGRGHKGQHARAGGFHKLGFEGGQMPIQRRLPKFGFTSRKALFSTELRISDLNKLDGVLVNLQSLHDSGLINANIKHVKIIAGGDIHKPIQVVGIKVTKGARASIESAGGKIEETNG